MDLSGRDAENRPMEATRREFLQAGAAAALAASLPGSFDHAAAGASRPNFLVIVVDTLRADHVGAYGGRAETPFIDALAARGLRLSHFYPEAMATVPARRSILSGRRIWPFRGWEPQRGLRDTPGWAPISAPSQTFTSALKRAAYWTGYATDNPFLGYARSYGRFRSSFDHFARIGGQLGRAADAKSVSRAQLNAWLVPELRVSHIEQRMRRFIAAGERYWEDESRSWAARVFGAGAQALERAAARQPFALVVDTYEPHEPWTPPGAYIDLYGDSRYRGPEPGMSRYDRVDTWLSRQRAPKVLGRMRDLYAAEVTMTDRWLGSMIARLGQLGLAGNTVIVLVADHGYLLGEHGWTGKIASILHPELIHVPCLIVDPRRPGGRRSDFLAQTHDIGPTLLSLAGVARPPGMDGIDLSPLLSGKPPAERAFAFGGYANWHYARTTEWAYISANTGRGRRLYDLDRDPGERRDIARRHPKRINELRQALYRRSDGPPPVFR
jgi:arylsulfatase A-like enzyme